MPQTASKNSWVTGTNWLRVVVVPTGVNTFTLSETTNTCGNVKLRLFAVSVPLVSLTIVERKSKSRLIRNSASLITDGRIWTKFWSVVCVGIKLARVAT
jgi:hypothetical protein